MLLLGCAPTRYYSSTEQTLGTSGFVALQSHMAAYYPSGISLDFPGYLVGIEESGREHVPTDEVVVVKPHLGAGASMERVKESLFEFVPYVSHVFYYAGKPYGEGNCALYNVYQTTGQTIMDFCDGAPRPRVNSLQANKSAYRDSWEAVDLLKQRLEADVDSGQYSHLLVVIMGWDTGQEEAVRNFNSIAWSIRRSGRSDFRPLFVGITWPSLFAGRWFDPLWEIISYPGVADTADRLGLAWVGVILNEAVMPLTPNIRTAVVAHSFGARMASTALCIGPAIKRSETAPETVSEGSIGLVVGLEAAFSLQRFREKPFFFLYEDVYFPDACSRIDRLILTASRNDAATRMAVWADLAGNHRYQKRFCRQSHSFSVACVKASADGQIVTDYNSACRLLYIDASELIRANAPGTDGGAHSDIFKPAVGRLLWSLLNGAH